MQCRLCVLQLLQSLRDKQGSRTLAIHTDLGAGLPQLSRTHQGVSAVSAVSGKAARKRFLFLHSGKTSERTQAKTVPKQEGVFASYQRWLFRAGMPAGPGVGTWGRDGVCRR